MQKKVAFLDFSPIFAGAERVLYNAIAHLDRSKYEPILVFPYPMEHQRRYADLGCETLYLAKSKAWWMGSDRWAKPLRGTDFIKRTEFGRRLARLVRRRKIDIVDVNLLRRDVGMWVWATRRFTDAKIVGHYRSQSQGFVPPASAQKLFDVVACVSEFSRGRFRLGGVFTRSEVLYDSVDVDLMRCDKTPAQAKASLGYSPDDLLLVSVGQLSIRKGHDTAIEAFAKIADDFPNARLLVAGGGNAEEKAIYCDLARRLGVDNKVHIPGTQVSNMPEVYKAADLTLSLTKDGEGFGLVPYESALLGTPCIGPEIGAIREFISDGENGLLVDTNNVEAVIEKMRSALTDLSSLSVMVERLCDTINRQLRPERLSANLTKLYSSLLYI